MKYELFEQLKKVLEKDERLVAEGELLRNRIVELARQGDALLLKHLLADAQTKSAFFTDVEGVQVFDSERFVRFVNNKEFLPDSYTAFKNKIGLAEGDEFVSEKKEVVLNWPYKDCVLEGGQTKEDAKRDEVFWNETLAPDQIHRLLDLKVFTDLKRIDAKGEHPLASFKTDENGDIKDNLIVKGNNLLALHSLKARFAGKVKLIYIDPPYNPDSKSNTFAYNNNFNESTWLTFMRNRLEVAKKLLMKEGAMIVAIDENEQAALTLLLKEMFAGYEIHCITIVHNPRGVQGTNFSYVHEYALFVIPKGLKTIGSRKIEEEEISLSNFRNWGGESSRADAKNCFYPVIVKDDQIVGFGEVLPDSQHPQCQTEKRGEEYYVYPIDKNGIERKWRYARQSADDIKGLLQAKHTKTGYEIEIGKDFGVYRTVWEDPRYDANEYGTKIVRKLVPSCKFDFPKSLWNVYDCLHAVVGEDKDAIVLDFFGGSGTTAHAVIELNKDGGNRKFILAEQMGYVQFCTVPRVVKALELCGSKDSFVYTELMPLNQVFKEKVEKAKDAKELAKVWDEIQEKGFLSYKLDMKEFNKEAKDFAALPLVDQKRFILESLDYNQLYVNKSEIEDVTYHVSPADKKLNKEFYGRD